MHLSLFRKQGSPGDATLGTLIVTDKKGGVHMTCGTLEPKIRKEKIKGHTAIPAGTYTVEYAMSQKFGKKMPFLKNVPNFTGVMLHVGNELKDTEGCILVGEIKDMEKAYIYNSRLTFNLLDAIIKNEKELRIHIYDPYEE